MSEFSRHPEGLNFSGLQSKLSRSDTMLEMPLVVVDEEHFLGSDKKNVCHVHDRRRIEGFVQASRKLFSKVPISQRPISVCKVQIFILFYFTKWNKPFTSHFVVSSKFLIVQLFPYTFWVILSCEFLSHACEGCESNCGANLGTPFCVEVFVEFYVYTLIPRSFPFFYSSLSVHITVLYPLMCIYVTMVTYYFSSQLLYTIKNSTGLKICN